MITAFGCREHTLAHSKLCADVDLAGTVQQLDCSFQNPDPCSVLVILCHLPFNSVVWLPVITEWLQQLWPCHPD